MLKAFTLLLGLLLFTGQTAFAGFIANFEPVWEKYGRSKAGSASSGRTSGTDFTDPTTGMEFVLVKGGCYQMGSNGDGKDEEPVDEVCVDDFYLGKFEVTQGEWQKIEGNNPSSFKGNNRPVEKVSWNDAQDYIGKLNKNSSKRYRLPTEAEWEYAARSGGKSEKYAGGNDIDAVAWYAGNSGNKTHPVGQKGANGFGLYDMSGNVWEWCSDWYGSGYYAKSRVRRGGGGSGSPDSVRTASRYWIAPGGRLYYQGFRLALPAM